MSSSDSNEVNGAAESGHTRSEHGLNGAAQAEAREPGESEPVATPAPERIEQPSGASSSGPDMESGSPGDDTPGTGGSAIAGARSAFTESASNAEDFDSVFSTPDGREKLTDARLGAPDQKIENDQETFHRKLLTRVSAKNIRFKNVSFFQTIFDTCYFNHCVFDSCTFVGCRFVACNFNQSSFPGCKFDYAVFERTQVDDDILSRAPERHNLKLKFARTLRMNYQQVGDAKAVNRAIVLELDATSVFLKESWSSDSSYYREKYAGFSRVRQFLKWFEFTVLDFIWGNGESVAKLLRSIMVVILMVGIMDMVYTPGAKLFMEYLKSFYVAPSIFLGVKSLPKEAPPLLVSGIAALRLVGFAFLTAILVKRFGRR